MRRKHLCRRVGRAHRLRRQEPDGVCALRSRGHGGGHSVRAAAIAAGERARLRHLHQRAVLHRPGLRRRGGAAPAQKYRRLGEVYEDNRDNLFLVSLVLRVTNLSNDILGLFFGALGMNYWQYLASSFVGILPTMVLYTVLGNDLDLTSTPVLICMGVDVACIAAAWLVLRLRKKRKGKPNEEKAL